LGETKDVIDFVDNNCPLHKRITAIWQKYGIEGSALYHSLNASAAKKKKQKEDNKVMNYTITDSKGNIYVKDGMKSVADFLGMDEQLLNKMLRCIYSIRLGEYTITKGIHLGHYMAIYRISDGFDTVIREGQKAVSSHIGLGVQAVKRRLRLGNGTGFTYLNFKVERIEGEDDEQR
jgi:hypothetical protein